MTSRAGSKADLARYELIRELGRGAMGEVDLVYDRERERHLARKRPALRDAGAVVRFKTEFRVLAELEHSNLVRVFDLGEDGIGLYFTMEWVDGVPFDAFVRQGDRLVALKRTLPQLLDALSYMHRQGVIHRDLKPQNLLVTREGVLKVLDFGILGRWSSEPELGAGTPGYMAPEQIRGERLGPEADLYSVGALLFETMADQPVFQGTRATVLDQHLHAAPRRLRELVPNLPGDLDVACFLLLSKLPDQRPRLAELRERLLPALGVESRHRSPEFPARLFDRDALIASVVERLTQKRRVVLVGPSGIGKTAVTTEIAREIARRGGVVFQSSVRLNERVAFNAMDGIVDALARRLDRPSGRGPELERASRKARVIFPALALTGVSHADRSKELVRFRLFGRAHSVSRAEAFDGVCELLERAAERCVLVVDDFQWADDDSLAMLDHLLDTGLDSLAALLVIRSDAATSRVANWIRNRAELETVEVPPLAKETMLAIGLAAAQSRGLTLELEALHARIPELRGRPLLAEVVGRALAIHESTDLSQLVQHQSEIAREILALLVASDDWTRVRALAEISWRPRWVVDESLDELARAGLTRLGGADDGEELADLYHDGVRAAAASALESLLPAAHSKLADHWTATPGAPLERRVRHLLGASRMKEAADLARLAASSAEEQRAYGLAAEMYAVVLRTEVTDADQLDSRRAAMLEKVGRYAEAAEVWSKLRSRANSERELELALSEATALVAANCTNDGLDRLDRVLQKSGEPPAQAQGPRQLAAAATFLLGPAGARVRRVLLPVGRGASRALAERDVRLGILLCFIDPSSGVRYLLRAHDEFRAAGDLEQVAHCNYMFAVLALVQSRRRRVPLAERYLLEARRTLVAQRESHVANGMEAFVSGLMALRRAEWAPARAGLDRAKSEFLAHGAATEQLMTASFRTMCDVYPQDLEAVRRSVAELRQSLSELGGGIISAHVDLTEGYIRYLEGDPDDTERFIRRIIQAFAGPRRNVQRAGAELYVHLADIYRDDRHARAKFADALAAARGFRFLSTMYAGPFAMIGALLEANALRRGEPGARFSRVEHFARILELAPPLAAGAGERARGYALDALGRHDEALAALRRAEIAAERHGRRVDLAIARFQLSRRLGGDQGASTCESARSLIAASGASERLLYEDAGSR